MNDLNFIEEDICDFVRQEFKLFANEMPYLSFKALAEIFFE